MFVKTFLGVIFALTSLPVLSTQCTSHDDVRTLLATGYAENAAAKANIAARADSLRAAIIERAAAFGWSEERKANVYQEAKKTEQYVSLEKQRNKVMQQGLDLSRTVENLSDISDWGRKCAHIQMLQTLAREKYRLNNAMGDVLITYIDQAGR